MINQIIGKNKDKTNVIDCLRVGELEISSSHEITNHLADYFANVGKTFANKIPPSRKKIKQYLNEMKSCSNTLFLSPVTEAEVDGLIRKLPNKTSSGYDSINNVLVKKVRIAIVKPLTIIFNNSITSGVFPTNMKYADVIPLHKSKDKRLATNYRPISLLIVISKLLEKIMHKRTYEFLQKNNLIYDSQYGFREKHSCENAVSELVGEITKNLELNKSTIAIFLDLSKAFDTLNHEVLLNKLDKYGIRGTSLDWYRSYLTGRQMRTKCNITSSENTEYSEFIEVEYGAPQGSCLGPLLFLIFTNDLHSQLQHTHCILFADDTTVYKGHHDIRFLKWCLEEDLLMLSDWFRANQLTLNLGKTVGMLFTNKKNISVELSILGSSIPFVNETKFLGVWIDKRLNWDSHINRLNLKLNQNKNLLHRGKNLLKTATKKLVYYAHLYSHITYGIVVWGNQAHKTQLQKLQRIQNLKDVLTVVLAVFVPTVTSVQPIYFIQGPRFKPSYTHFILRK